MVHLLAIAARLWKRISCIVLGTVLRLGLSGKILASLGKKASMLLVLFIGSRWELWVMMVSVFLVVFGRSSGEGTKRFLLMSLGLPLWWLILLES